VLAAEVPPRFAEALSASYARLVARRAAVIGPPARTAPPRGVGFRHGIAPKSATTYASAQTLSSKSARCQFATSSSLNFQLASVTRTACRPSPSRTTSLAIRPAGPGSVFTASTAMTLRPGTSIPATSNHLGLPQQLLLASLSPASFPFKKSTNILSQVTISSADVTCVPCGSVRAARKNRTSAGYDRPSSPRLDDDQIHFAPSKLIGGALAAASAHEARRPTVANTSPVALIHRLH